MEVSGTHPRGRPCTRWRDNIRNDMSFFEVREEDAMDRKVWKRKIQDPDPSTQLDKEVEEEEEAGAICEIVCYSAYTCNEVNCA